MKPEQNSLPVSNFKEYARVHIVDAPFHVDKEYCYYLTPELRQSVRIGSFITVPFGYGNKKQIAVVVGLLGDDELEYTNKIKPAVSLILGNFVLDSELLRLCGYMRENCFCTFGQAVRTVIPPAAFGKICEYFYILTDLPDKYLKDIQISMVYNTIKKASAITAQRLELKLDHAIDVRRALRVLLSAEIIASALEHRDTNHIYRDTTKIVISEEDAKEAADAMRKRSPKRAAVLDAIIEEGSITTDALKERFGEVREAIKSLKLKGYIDIDRTELYRDPYASSDPLPPPDDNILSDEQSEAFTALADLYDSGEAKAALLQGVTGSGKTRVIKALCDRVIESGRSVIMLVPEIALTPQTVQYFRACYKDRIAVIHSSLSQGERLDMYNRIRRGEVDICVGTRSAVFAPFTNLGLIVIDEEQEHTYKSDMDPKYHARDIARFRCAHNSAMMLLASATPSLESRHKAESGIYSLVKLNSRYGEAKLPEVIIADMRQETAVGKISPIGDVLKAELADNLSRGEQSILLLNRRGFNNFVTCPQCGSVITCPHCSVSMTYHTYRLRGERGDGCLACHYCGTRQQLPEKCPTCGGEHLSFMGFGTQKIEKELSELFPEARILRMDADTTSTKFAYEEILGKFRDGQADILIGTQMVAKGHDFPNVTLSAVLSADSALYLDDYHASERTFSMICQLVGRAGRGSKSGRALIQTYNPDHPVVMMAAAQDYDSFYKNEIALRRALIFPPFCDIALITVISEDESTVLLASDELGEFIQKGAETLFPGLALDVFGPFEAPIYKVKEKYRIRVVIKCRSNAKTRKFLRYIAAEWSSRLSKTATITIDMNPNSL